jgi:hypothetical protein
LAAIAICDGKVRDYFMPPRIIAKWIRKANKRSNAAIAIVFSSSIAVGSGGKTNAVRKRHGRTRSATKKWLK